MVRHLVVGDHVAGIAAEARVDAVNHLTGGQFGLQRLTAALNRAAKIFIFAETNRATPARNRNNVREGKFPGGNRDARTSTGYRSHSLTYTHHLTVVLI